jgi:hypothetical protein
MKTNELVFPVKQIGNDLSTGMTLRDYFAGLAMQGMITRTNQSTKEEISEYAYEVADAMLEERSKE